MAALLCLTQIFTLRPLTSSRRVPTGIQGQFQSPKDLSPLNIPIDYCWDMLPKAIDLGH